MKKSKVYDLSDEEFRQIVKDSFSLSECCKKIGFSIYGRNGREQIKKRCLELGISIEHFKLYGRNTNSNPRPLEEILVQNSTYTNTDRLKKRLVDIGLLEYKCLYCGNTGQWMDNPISLQLHHINGNHSDNRIENLCILCPNCHSQTENYSSRQRRANSDEKSEMRRDYTEQA